MASVVRIALIALLSLVVTAGLAYGAFRLAVMLGSYEVNLPEATSLIPETADRGRYIKLLSVPNFRSVGGYRTIDGALVHPGAVYRSADWADLSVADAERIAALGIRTVVDLRSVPEREAAPDVLPEGVQSISIPIFSDAQGMGPVVWKLLFRRRALYDYMRDGYVVIVRDYAEELGEVLRLFAEPANLPIVIHCATGKDRTGVAVALLLSLLGVPEPTVLDEYSLSNMAFSLLLDDVADPRFRSVGLQPIDVGPLLLADPAWLDGALSFVKAQYGSMDRYFRIRAGLTDLELAQIRENLLASGR